VGVRNDAPSSLYRRECPVDHMIVGTVIEREVPTFFFCWGSFGWILPPKSPVDPSPHVRASPELFLAPSPLNLMLRHDPAFFPQMTLTPLVFSSRLFIFGTAFP